MVWCNLLPRHLLRMFFFASLVTGHSDDNVYPCSVQRLVRVPEEQLGHSDLRDKLPSIGPLPRSLHWIQMVETLDSDRRLRNGFPKRTRGDRG